MTITNVHERIYDADPDDVGALVDSLASDDDRLWPSDRWPPMRLDRPLGIGASGGHRPIGYLVEAYEPGRLLRFRFTRPEGFIGHHRFEVEDLSEGRTRLRHVIEMRARGADRLKWSLAIRHLHDALIEDALDRAADQLGVGSPSGRSATGSTAPEERRWSLWVRLLRHLLARRRTA